MVISKFDQVLCLIILYRTLQKPHLGLILPLVNSAGGALRHG